MKIWVPRAVVREVNRSLLPPMLAPPAPRQLTEGANHLRKSVINVWDEGFEEGTFAEDLVENTSERPDIDLWAKTFVEECLRRSQKHWGVKGLWWVVKIRGLAKIGDFDLVGLDLICWDYHVDRKDRI